MGHPWRRTTTNGLCDTIQLRNKSHVFFRENIRCPLVTISVVHDPLGHLRGRIGHMRGSGEGSRCRAPHDEATRQWLIAVALLVPCVLMVAVLFAPLGYAVTPSGIVVRRMGPNVFIDRRQIAEVRRMRPRDVGLVLRTFGSGGFFGFFGWCYSRPLGHFKAYATNRRNLVLVQLADGAKFLLSPHPAETFVEILRLRDTPS